MQIRLSGSVGLWKILNGRFALPSLLHSKTPSLRALMVENFILKFGRSFGDQSSIHCVNVPASPGHHPYDPAVRMGLKLSLVSRTGSRLSEHLNSIL